MHVHFCTACRSKKCAIRSRRTITVTASIRRMSNCPKDVLRRPRKVPIWRRRIVSISAKEAAPRPMPRLWPARRSFSLIWKRISLVCRRIRTNRQRFPFRSPTSSVLAPRPVILGRSRLPASVLPLLTTRGLRLRTAVPTSALEALRPEESNDVVANSLLSVWLQLSTWYVLETLFSF